MPTTIHQANFDKPRIFALAVLNSSLDDAEIIPYLDNLKASGYEGICIHPRDGLRVPYATRSYWKRIEHIMALAQERGFVVWYYDEYPFPSGMAGGSILADDPSSVVRSLQFDLLDTTLNHDGLIEVGPQGLLALLRYRVDDSGQKFDVRDVTEDCGAYLDTWVWGEWHNRFYTGALHVREEQHERAAADRFTRTYIPETPLEPDEQLLAIKIVPEPFRVGLPGRPDITRPEVTQRFLEQIYSRFAELSNAHSLADVPVFQDEVSFGAVWPWNAEIENRLRPLWGERFAEKLAGLHAPDVVGWESARYEYRAATQDTFERNWFELVAEYCHAHGLRMTGHLAGEESLLGHCQLLGNAFKNLAHFDIPGFDIISSTIPDGINRSSALGIKIVQSAAWCAGRKPTMVEVFAAHGFHSDLQRQRNVLAWLGVHDLVKVFDHSTYLSGKSVRKYDAPPVSSRFNPLDVGRADLWSWHQWFADLMAEYSFCPQTLVLFPFESLTRYCMAETELWQSEIALLETWFHTLFAHSLDALLLPSHRLLEVEATTDGFVFNGHTFTNFVVPPFASFYEDVWEQLLAFTKCEDFAWCIPHDCKTIKVFDADGQDQQRPLPTQHVFACDEAALLAQRSTWFDGVLASPLSAVTSDVELIKTCRRNAADEVLHIVINPHDTPIRIHTPKELGEPLPQPHTGAREPSPHGERTLAAREVLVFRPMAVQESSVAATTSALTAQAAQFRFCAPNQLKLQVGRICLEGYDERDFSPAPVSTLWTLHGLQHTMSDVGFAAPYTHAALPHPHKLQAMFPIQLNKALESLAVLLDDESAPNKMHVHWNGVLLSPQRSDVFDQANTVYPIPLQALGAGEHTLSLEGEVNGGAQGILERPILIGNFLANDAETNCTPQLKAQPTTALPWNGENWTKLGIPEGFGPVDYEFVFTLNEDQAQLSWELELPMNTGIAEVFLDEALQGRTSWEPRRVSLSTLQVGDNPVRVRVHGSWNNVFSRLNRVENGLTAWPKLNAVADTHTEY